jgi:hypothetical protein
MAAEVPFWVLRAATASHGCRLPQKPEHVTGYTSVGTAMAARTPMHQWKEGNNLPQGEYRFWEGSHWLESDYARCRACGSIVREGVEARKRHMEKEGCTTLLVRAYAQMLKDRACAVCDKHTKQSMWGVPLCSKDCVERWKGNNPHSLGHILSRLLLREGKDEKVHT